MTTCITDPFGLSRVSRNQTKADFDAGRLISDAGTLLLCEADYAGLIDHLNDCIPGQSVSPAGIG